jgi:chaperonin GroEL
MNPSPSRRVVFQPAASQRMKLGARQIYRALRPTLGPRPRLVAMGGVFGQETPVFFDNGGDIVRNIIQIPDRDADMGAMLLRDSLWRLQRQVGDGTATSAVLFYTVFEQGVKYLQAGGNALLLRAHLESGLRLILETLQGQSFPLESRKQIAQLAWSICGDPELSELFGEIFEILGEFGRLEIRPGQSRRHEREYVEGIYWDRGLMSRDMITDPARLRAEFENVAILISDLELTTVDDLLPALAAALQAKLPALIIIASHLSDSVKGFLMANKNPAKFQTIAVTTPGFAADQRTELEDLAVLTGGKVYLRAAGQTFAKVTAQDFGSARRAWADLTHFGVIGGQGQPQALRRHIANLRAAFEQCEDPVARGKLRQRIGKLMGGSATLWVGGEYERQIKTRVEVAERTAEAVRGAMRDGVLPGGGVALLQCRLALLERMHASLEPDERAAYAILARAVEEPIRAIIENSGAKPGPILAEIDAAGPCYGYDAQEGRVCLLAEAGILDPVVVLKSAVHAAVSSAALALTVDVLVHCREPEKAPLSKAMRPKQL